MRILHISQGLPPFRSGGLTTYCVSLMQAQQRDHNVSLLYPGHYSIGKTRIRRKASKLFELYELINPLPLALIFGISQPERYMQTCEFDVYERFFKAHSFDIIHVHSTMGVHKECFKIAKQLGVKMVFTTHDYYLLCLLCTFIKSGNRVCFQPGGKECWICNAGKGISSRYNFLMQSDLYQAFKQSGFLKFARMAAKRNLSNKNSEAKPSSAVENYIEVLHYNREILGMMDIIHCNSSQTEQVYRRFEPELRYVVSPITHSTLPEKSAKGKAHDTFRIVHLNGFSKIKGFPTLMSAVSLLDEMGFCDWELQIFGRTVTEMAGTDKRIKPCGPFDPAQLGKVLEGADAVVVASICYETFGFVTLEALAAGIPVIVSDRVGSKDLVENAPIPMIFSADNAQALAERLIDLKKNLSVTKAWAQNLKVLDMKCHAKQIESLYERND